LEQYRVKEENKKSSELRFRPYGPLSEDGITPSQRITKVESLIESNKYEEAVEETDVLIAVGLEGLRYLQTYDWLFLRTLITLGYVGWMAYAITMVVDKFVLFQTTRPQRGYLEILGSTSILAALYASFLISKSPPTYYVYAFFPVLFWEEVFAHRTSISKGRQALFGHITSVMSLLTFLSHVIQYVVVILSLVSNINLGLTMPNANRDQAFGYIQRETLSVLFVCLTIWPFTYGLKFIKAFPLQTLSWVCVCMAMSVFTTLSAVKTEDLTLL
jgi:GPI ethanolamine phosphate transferase 1